MRARRQSGGRLVLASHLGRLPRLQRLLLLRVLLQQLCGLGAMLSFELLARLIGELPLMLGILLLLQALPLGGLLGGQALLLLKVLPLEHALSGRG